MHIDIRSLIDDSLFVKAEQEIWFNFLKKNLILLRDLFDIMWERNINTKIKITQPASQTRTKIFPW